MSAPGKHFEQVWFRSEPPERGRDAFAATRVGSLDFDLSGITFASPGFRVAIDRITEVRYDRVAPDFVNRWIILTHHGADGGGDVFLKDGGWRGWRPLLTRSNRRILVECERVAASR